MSNCWYWDGIYYPSGYGQVYSPAAKRQINAHRFVWEMLVGPIPSGLQLDHLCRIRGCVNPAHLRPVTLRENVLAPGSRSPSAIHAAKTHCPRGHAYDAKNTSITSLGRRRCKACHVIEEGDRQRRRAKERGAVPQSSKTQCPQGHPYDAANTYIDRTNRRHCRRCGREQMREYSRRRRASALGFRPDQDAVDPRVQGKL